MLAVFGRGLPRALRLFLLTLAVVDDLLAIVVIAIGYTEHISGPMLAAALAAVGVFAVLVRLRRTAWWLLLPVAVVAWGFMHASGVHATIAGVALGFCVPAVGVHGEAEPRTHRYDDLVRPWSAGVALPVFAFFAAGVTLTGGTASAVGQQPVFHAVLVGCWPASWSASSAPRRWSPGSHPCGYRIRSGCAICCRSACSPGSDSPSPC